MPCFSGKPGKIRLTGEYRDGTKFEDVFDSVVFAVGRDAETSNINLKGKSKQDNTMISSI